MGKKKKVIRHIGMTMTPDEHRKLMEHLGISKEEDEKWHKAQAGRPAAPDTGPPGDPVNPFAIGGAFLQYCVGQGWLIQQGTGRAMKYYVTEMGREALAEYGITKY